MSSALLDPRNMPWQVERAEQAELLVDADVYYASFYRAALLARRHIYLVGWQFDSLARLLRRPELGALSGVILIYTVFFALAGDSGMFTIDGIINGR